LGVSERRTFKRTQKRKQTKEKIFLKREKEEGRGEIFG